MMGILNYEFVFKDLIEMTHFNGISRGSFIGKKCDIFFPSKHPYILFRIDKT